MRFRPANIRVTNRRESRLDCPCAASYDKIRDKKTIIDRSFHIRLSKNRGTKPKL